MINTQILQNIWLTEIESKIYICLLEKWTLWISKIAELWWLNRMQIYAALPHLIEKHLISESTHGKRKKYSAEDPDNLENIFYEQKLMFKNTLEIMKSTYDKKMNIPQLRTFYTRKAMKHIFHDIIDTLEHSGTYYRYSSRKDDHMRWFLWNSYKEKRDKKQIQRMVITSSDLKKAKEAWKINLNREIAAIPKKYDLFEDNISKMIYANKVAIIDYNTDTSFIIENKKFADFEKKIFKLLFKHLRERG